jgi:hypothetical protein
VAAAAAAAQEHPEKMGKSDAPDKSLQPALSGKETLAPNRYHSPNRQAGSLSYEKRRARVPVLDYFGHVVFRDLGF